jgi:hypothetical protein
MYKIRYGFLFLLIFLGILVSFCMGFTLGKSKIIPTPTTTSTYKSKFPPICRIYVSPEGMIDVSSPTGEVEVYSENQNTVIEGLSNEEE